MEKPFFSINIPAFNCENYILDAIRSVARQSCSEWEIIVVDDGSTDGTLSCLNSQQIVPKEKITIIHQENHGPWEARKVAHQHSVGEYVVSLDGDDMLLCDDALSRIHDEIQHTECDILLINATRDTKRGNMLIDYASIGLRGGVIVEASQLQSAMRSSAVLNNICAKVYRRKLMDFGSEKRTLVMGEDRLQSFILLGAANTCSLLNEPLYFYRINPFSTTNAVFRIEKLQDLLAVEEFIDDSVCHLEKDNLRHVELLCIELVEALQSISKTINSREKRIKKYSQIVLIIESNALFMTRIPMSARADRWLICNLLRLRFYSVLDRLLQLQLALKPMEG